eukprot:CAMPEP_0169262102 /NCGR_PEP_ID=MMETSP1016-20121227/43498_1 /TAXON_ID=342587 /ORGANISM="Karlodinium micrum, Strain CCMP2283" /LENGTH=58 /DNA_ID=CAMNT_0009344545 /DNA_START=793 /DNA_END=969 /DNA_ORIENTATION=+
MEAPSKTPPKPDKDAEGLPDEKAISVQAVTASLYKDTLPLRGSTENHNAFMGVALLSE